MELQLSSLATTHQAAVREAVLIIDDDEHFCQLLGKYLAPHGFAVSYTWDAETAIGQLRSDKFSGVILDVLLPNSNGFDLLRHIRSFSEVPILMLTGRTREADRVLGLETGADDYVVKGTSSREVLARLRTLMRRANGATLQNRQPPDLRVGRLRISFRARCAYLSGSPIALTQTEFRLLASLARHMGTALTRNELVSELAAAQVPLNADSINVHISALRHKLGETGGSPIYIHTVRGVGYKLTLAQTP